MELVWSQLHFTLGRVEIGDQRSNIRIEVSAPADCIAVLDMTKWLSALSVAVPSQGPACYCEGRGESKKGAETMHFGVCWNEKELELELGVKMDWIEVQYSIPGKYCIHFICEFLPTPGYLVHRLDQRSALLQKGRSIECECFSIARYRSTYPDACWGPGVRAVDLDH